MVKVSLSTCFFVLDHNQIGRPRLGLDLKYAKKKVCQEFVSVDWITCCIQSNLFFLLEIIPPVWSVAWSIALYSVGVENQECSIDEEIRFANMPACLSETWNVQNEWRTNCLPETQTLASLADWTLTCAQRILAKLWFSHGVTPKSVWNCLGLKPMYGQYYFWSTLFVV